MSPLSFTACAENETRYCLHAVKSIMKLILLPTVFLWATTVVQSKSIRRRVVQDVALLDLVHPEETRQLVRIVLSRSTSNQMSARYASSYSC